MNKKRDKDNANKARKYHKMKKYKTKDLPLLLALFFVALSSSSLFFFVDESPAHYSFIIEKTYIKFPIAFMKKLYMKFKEKYIKVKQT